MAASSAKYILRGVIIGTISTATITFIWAKQNLKDKFNVDYQEDKSIQTPQHYLKRGSEILKYGIPDRGTNIRFYKNHVLVYDQQKKIPMWVAEHLEKDNLRGDANRKRSFFKADPKVDDLFHAHNSDYLGSGWSRGHMAPAGDNKNDQDAMDETFLLSNVLPQDLDNNSGFWNRFEIYCRELTKTFSNVYVISGPLFLSRTEEDGKRYVRYQVIGESEVAVPTHLYKVIITEDENRNLQLGAFIIPNQSLDSSHQLRQFQVPMLHLEVKTGIKFFRGLQSRFSDLCSVNECKLVDGKDLDIHYIKRELYSVKNTESLNRVWHKVEKKSLHEEKVLKDLYNEKKLLISKEL